MDPALIITSACDCRVVGIWDYSWLDMNDESRTRRLEVQYVKRFRSVLGQFSQAKSCVAFLNYCATNPADAFIKMNQNGAYCCTLDYSQPNKMVLLLCF